jgi:ABC-type polysaccharide/polyol phosphate export permease
VLTSVADVVSSKELLLNLTAREVKGKYKRTVLGQLWSLINPLALMGTYAIVFGFLLRGRPDPGNPSGLDVFALWLSAALLPWIFFTNVLTSTMSSILANENLVKKVSFPRSTLVISAALAALFTSFFEMAVLLVVVYAFGGNPTIYIPLVALALICLGALGLGIGFFLAVANVYFRDTQHFIAILLQLWFYATPIVYPITTTIAKRATGSKHWILTVYRLNPAERFSELFRNLIYDNKFPGAATMLYCVVVSLVVLVAGFAFFSRFEGRLAEEL